MPARQLPSQVRAKCGNLFLADPMFDKPAPVELLIGADIFPQVWNDKSDSLGPGYPSVYSSIFGWVLIGPVQTHLDVGAQSMLVSLVTSTETMLEKFWSVEKLEVAPLQFTEDSLCEKIFSSEVTRNSQGRFSVPLPLRFERMSEEFPGSRQVALDRFPQLERKLSADKIIDKAYCKFMSNYEEFGHMSRAEGDGQYFIPHHAIQKVVEDNVKLRVVFDASAECHSGLSLNQYSLVGLKLQQDIFDVLTGFRVHKVAFKTDICKMYRQINVLSQYREYQYILWRDSPQVMIKEYILNTVTYGVNYAPYLALRVLQYIADTDCEDLPDVQRALLNQTYMDDICVGVESLEAAQALQIYLIRLLGRSGLELKKWTSNSPELLSKLKPENCSTDPLTFDQDNFVQVLGMRWNPSGDFFSFYTSNFKLILTKRGVLSIIARIFDPLGLLSPTIFYAKTIMQRLWLAQVDWDSQIPEDIANNWCGFYHSLSWLREIRIPRYLGSSTGCSYSLCGFFDASEKDYAAVVYLRVTDPSGSTSIYLLGAKTKLAPMKTMTIPSLQLSGAVLLALWLTRLKGILEIQLVLSDVFAWSDSSIVLSWLNNPHTSYKMFVSNRVFQIQSVLAHLCPSLDSANLVRVGGHMQNSNWSERRKHPILIPKESHLAVLIVRHWHLYACHARLRLLIALVQQQFWIIGIRLIVHQVIRKCLICAKMSAANPQPIMADLPSFRVQEAHPFSVVEIDYAGPLKMKELSLRKARIVKVYIAVFVCMTTKALHLESVTALFTEAFQLTLDRFVAHCGLPASIYSDCGTNFIGAAHQLRHLVNHPDSRNQLAGYIACEWHFNPPGASHFGGIWEAAVKSAKSLLLRVMSSQVWMLEEFTTVLCRVEAAMNSRPLVPTSPDPNDLECLTPCYFLVGRPLMSIPEPIETDTHIGL